MEQGMNISGGTAGQTAESMELDERVSKDMHGLVQEAAERLTFHRVECERWGRVGEAAASALLRLQSASPVAQASPEQFASAAEAPPVQARF